MNYVSATAPQGDFIVTMTGKLTGNAATTEFALHVHVYMDPGGLLPNQI